MDLKCSYDAWQDKKENLAFPNLKHNPKEFYKFVRSKSNIKSGVVPFSGKDEELINDENYGRNFERPI